MFKPIRTRAVNLQISFAVGALRMVPSPEQAAMQGYQSSLLASNE
jgi:hypothetical protein